MAERETGRVKMFNAAKGFGFIERPQGGDVFVHCSCIRGAGFRTLSEGQKVEYLVTEGPKGPRAQDVNLITAEVQQVSQVQTAATAVAEAEEAPETQDVSVV